ncbi:RICIN domain-containing protein [Streptomyces sp. P38-E01]|uniref:RICIN domain-containing protein n=1 Tax=Streptomyces tardus TaxID=2780544 RepID=A0A949N3U7_9ACTN|nr:RICIN domain-containing protein [Streptomyces tardus]MBU7600425.1 RICIN domain-containing protein [Streptomyces tardus]
MAETEQDDEKRRRRARFVDALATSAQQPGERSRVGTRIAGAVAVMALAAGATLGLGAWRTYQNAEEEKKQQVAAEQAAEEKKLTESHAAEQREREKREEERKKKEDEEKKKAAAEAAKPAPPAPTPTPEKESAAEMLRDNRAEGPQLRSKVLLKNVETGLCADVPGYGPGKTGKSINQHRCNGTSKDNQLWDIRIQYEDRGPGGAPLAIIANTKDDLCFDVPTRGPQPPGTPLGQAFCHPGIEEDNQLWWFEDAGNGTFKIRNFASNHQCLRVGKAAEGHHDRRLILERCTTGPESAWRIQR